MSVLVGLIVMLGMFVVVPAGLGLIDGPRPHGLRLLRRAWPLLALPGAVALWLPRSPTAATLAAVYALATLALALCAPARLVAHLRPPPAPGAGRRRAPAASEVAVLTALVTPSVAGLALVAERAGHELLGFDLGILALTVPHFHFAGFAAALVAGLVCRTSGSPATRFAALSVPLGTLLVLIGYFVDDWAELAGAVVLTAGMWAVALPTWRDLRTGAPDRVTRGLLAVSAVVLVATMLLALSWALGEATGLPHPNLTWMAATHGLGNALGFALCSLLAWRRLRAAAPSKETAPWPV
ncbi:YndJ family protein [Streptomyces sp. Je 1-79]|uniref:YndJ family protein n=1 Tax=Streptomyces sp. Je 1-79 TaxID=2943847 RepID=UPI0021A3E324|nr:YndJ family protein [Streptomyces sp. Je 1-79]MCT4353464.1 YndJ family protein [Streptomyces sp. Je 1-79]